MQTARKKWPISTIILFWASVAVGVAAGIGSVLQGYSIPQATGAALIMFVGTLVSLGMALSDRPAP